MAEIFSVSLATAFRHLRNNTTPATERREGFDGKSYPKKIPSSQVLKELARARAALKRANDTANEEGITNDDFSVLREILNLGRDMMLRWGDCLHE